MMMIMMMTICVLSHAPVLQKCPPDCKAVVRAYSFGLLCLTHRNKLALCEAVRESLGNLRVTVQQVCPVGPHMEKRRS